ncbi:STAS/SEC14 domain-containing protein [Phyllobacterium bourgognense]|uniref:SpoIIAA-like protein n=1 Tax=Phyllobacterium bourgognense TaxID=314236 RepID=A0A368YGE5_9HYPH|nr:STAS/SEC14 domain-containing protein [Phyllobacterium bourgognense]RCW78518.1 SpoIIAA-like protein [Phyllobacterium bourgognense]
MILLEPLRDQNILVITPQGPLEQADFETIAKAVDPVIISKGKVTGLMIRMKSFPGWRNFAAFAAHLKFVAHHHRSIECIAVVTSGGLLKIISGIAGYFVHPKIRLFGFNQREQALSWLETGR